MTSTITTNSMIQSRRGRTVRCFLAFSSGLSRSRRSCCSAARFLLDLSVSSSRRRNHVVGTRTSSSSKSCDSEDRKLHGRCRWISQELLFENLEYGRHAPKKNGDGAVQTVRVIQNSMNTSHSNIRQQQWRPAAMGLNKAVNRAIQTSMNTSHSNILP